MSVRLREWQDSKGVSRSCWEIFVKTAGPDGREVTHRRFHRGATEREARAIEVKIRTSIELGT
jgi:hypothetical protein